MRVKLTFISDKDIILPIHYNYILQSFIYSNIIDKHLVNFIYNDELRVNKKAICAIFYGCFYYYLWWLNNNKYKLISVSLERSEFRLINCALTKICSKMRIISK